MVERLKKDVWYMNRCCGCGACITTCLKNILVFPEEDHPVQETIEKRIGLSHITVDTCFFCEKTCEESCPRLREWGKGPIIHTVTTASRLPDADVINALLIASIRRKLVDGAIIWDIDKETFKPIPRIALTEDEILTARGYQYLWYPILKVINNAIYKMELKRIAVVGPPCVAQAVKAIRDSSNSRLKIYKDALYLVIGLFCEGTYTYQLVKEIVDRFNVNPYQLSMLTIDLKNRILRVTLQDELIRSVPLSEIRRYMKQGCVRCTDFFGEWADISIGRISLDEEKALAIVRTSTGKKCLDYAFMEKTLKPSEAPVSMEDLQKLIEDKERRKRIQEIDVLTSLMLESMLNVRQREEVREKLKLI